LLSASFGPGAFSISSIPRLSLPRNKRHEESKDQQNPSPPKINVNPERTLIHVRIGSEKAKEHQHSPKNREQVADRQPNIETHKIGSFRLLRHLKEDDVKHKRQAQNYNPPQNRALVPRERLFARFFSEGIDKPFQLVVRTGLCGHADNDGH
jgi:hypothetical protein